MEEYIQASGRTSNTIDNLLPEMWQEVCNRWGHLSFRMTSGSMEPLICVGDKVKVIRTEPSKLHIGDVVAFRNGRNVIIHRVTGKHWSDKQFTFSHRGDAGAVNGKFTANDLIGIVSSVKRNGDEIAFDTLRCVITGKILGWRLRITDDLKRSRYRTISNNLLRVLRLGWRLCRNFLLREWREQ